MGKTTFKIFEYTHIALWVIAILILILVKPQDHLRYDLGYVVVHLIFLSGICCLLSIPRVYSREKKIVLRLYFGIYTCWWLLLSVILIRVPIIGWFCIVIWMSFYSLLGGFRSLLYENEQYILRWDGDSKTIAYEKAGIIEKHIGEFDYHYHATYSDFKRKNEHTYIAVFKYENDPDDCYDYVYVDEK